MIEVFRVVENQARVYGFKATDDDEEAIQLEILIDITKPKYSYEEWDPLIATSFRYPLPTTAIYQARFRPAFSKRNVFYSSELLLTAMYEYTFHFMKQRVHLQTKKKKTKNETGSRTGFSVELQNQHCLLISAEENEHQILDKLDYSHSHRFIAENPEVEVIQYRSVRDPDQHANFAVLNIEKLGKKPRSQVGLNFFYNYRKKEITWIEQKLKISFKIFSND